MLILEFMKINYLKKLLLNQGEGKINLEGFYNQIVLPGSCFTLQKLKLKIIEKISH